MKKDSNFFSQNKDCLTVIDLPHNKLIVIKQMMFMHQESGGLTVTIHNQLSVPQWDPA